MDGVRRVVAPNAGMMTGPGTNTYLIGQESVAVIDPGPLIDSHLDAICNAAPDAIRWILVTHTHPDHSPAAIALAERTGAPLYGIPAPDGPHQDKTFIPDHVLADGDAVTVDDFTLRAVHTPGHASNHLCYLLDPKGWLFTGDHIMSGSTVVIDPPDGDMKAYLDALTGLKQLDLKALAPGHGVVIDEPFAAIDGLIEHRLKREAKVAAALEANPGLPLAALTAAAYQEVDASLHGLASRSLLAHLLKLEQGRPRRKAQ